MPREVVPPGRSSAAKTTRLGISTFANLAPIAYGQTEAQLAMVCAALGQDELQALLYADLIALVAIVRKAARTELGRYCKACGEQGDHYVASVGHFTHPDDAIDPYYTCTGEKATQVARRLRERR